MLNVAFAQGLPGEQRQLAPCSKNMGKGKRAHEKFSLLVATCMASMPPLKAHKDAISCGKLGSSLGMEAKQGIGLKVAWFWGVGVLKWGGIGHLKHFKACLVKCR
jgi:hypothetical protein